jgi:hypothetical protein
VFAIASKEMEKMSAIAIAPTELTDVELSEAIESTGAFSARLYAQGEDTTEVESHLDHLIAEFERRQTTWTPDVAESTVSGETEVRLRRFSARGVTVDAERVEQAAEMIGRELYGTDCVDWYRRSDESLDGVRFEPMRLVGCGSERAHYAAPFRVAEVQPPTRMTVRAAVDRLGRDHVRHLLATRQSFSTRAHGMWFANQLEAFEAYSVLADADVAEVVDLVAEVTDPPCGRAYCREHEVCSCDMVDEPVSRFARNEWGDGTTTPIHGRRS